jgi:hypothetical protein
LFVIQETEERKSTRKEIKAMFFEAADLGNDVDSGNHVLRSCPVPNMISCALECLSDSDCKSILLRKYRRTVGGDEPYTCHLISGRSYYSHREPAQTDIELYYFVAKNANDFYTKN